VSRFKLAVGWKTAAALLTGATLITTGVGVTAAAALVPAIQTDLLASNSAPASVARGSSFNVTESITNNGPAAAPGKLTITVNNATESAITPDDGLVCGGTTGNIAGTGFSQVCTTLTGSTLPVGGVLNVTLTLTPPTDPHVISVPVSAAVGFAVRGYTDTVALGNMVAKSVRIIDTADLAANFSGADTVGRTGSYVADGSITNNGTDPVYAKFSVVVGNATETGFTHDPGLNCADPVFNVAGTVYTRVCTTIAPLAAHASLPVELTLTPPAKPLVHALTVTGIAGRASGNLLDPVTTDNRAALRVPILDVADLSTTLTGPPHVVRGTPELLTGTVTNLGPDAVGGRAVIRVVGGVIASITADAPLACTGTGAVRTCTLTAPIPALTTLNFSIVVNPSSVSSVQAMTVTSTVSVLGGVTVTDPAAADNLATVSVVVDPPIG